MYFRCVFFSGDPEGFLREAAAPFCSGCLGGFPSATGMAAMAADDDMVVKAGPFELPNDGQHGTLTWADRQEIFGLTGVSAAVRDRKQTHGKRHLTLSGPMSGMDLAKKMAWQYVLNSQRQRTEFAETPGCEGDWVATKRKTASSSSSSSNNRSNWQTTMPMQVLQQQQAMMQQAAMQQQMMHHMMQPMFVNQGHLPGMPAMMQQHMMQPMFVPRPSSMHEVRQSDADDSDDEDAASPTIQHADEDAPTPARTTTTRMEPEKQKAAKNELDAKLDALILKQREVQRLNAILEEQREEEEALASPPARPAGKQVLASTSKSAGPPPVKAAPKKFLPMPKALNKKVNDEKKKVHDGHKDADDDGGADGDGPSGEANLASRRTVATNKKRKLISIRLDPTIQYVNIMSVGWRQQGVQYTPNFDDLLEGEHGLIWRLKVRGIAEPDIVVDCRPLKRYDLDKAILKHTGHSAEIVFHTVDHRLFKKTMQSALGKIQKVFDEGNGVNVLVVCTSGCHRSVSFALVMEYILKQQLFHCRVAHLSDGSWRQRRLCMSCNSCDEGNQWKAELFAKAASMVLE
jgi:hypothetical protein